MKQFNSTFDVIIRTTVKVQDLDNREPPLADMAITVPAGTPIGPENPVRPVLRLKQDRVIRVDQLQELLDECQKGLAQAAVRDREHAALLKAKYDQHALAAAPEASYSTGHWIACGLVVAALALFAASWWVRPGTQVAHS